MLKDMENVMVELKKMVDNCLTHTKLCDKPAPSVTIGEHLQLALNSHDGHLYLEQPNHIPEEYHKYFGIQPMISSPRSESNTLVTNPDDEDNSNSMMSGTSDKDHQHRDIGAQMVLGLEWSLGSSGPWAQMVLGLRQGGTDGEGVLKLYPLPAMAAAVRNSSACCLLGAIASWNAAAKLMDSACTSSA